MIGTGTTWKGRLHAAARKLGPWGVSIMLHAGLIGIGLIMTWSIIRLDDRLPSPVVTSEVVAMTPVMPLRAAPDVAQAPAPLPVPALAELAPPRPHVPGPPRAATFTPPAARFAGESMASARTVVFLIDASGSMVAWLPFVLDEVERTLASMQPTQRFAVVCFSGEDVRALPETGLMSASPGDTSKLMQRLRTLTARPFSKGSDPVAGFQTAAALRPELVLLLSEGLDGRGRWAVDRAATLAALDRLNPAGKRGSRPIQVNCIKLSSEGSDAPTVLMQAIDEAHGDGTVTMVGLEDLDQ
ncbi:MAG: vWA domain-containing protein [Phycisphaerales bacterium]|nr:vWA domain-containing protein [Phycisphaerales bacterium]